MPKISAPTNSSLDGDASKAAENSGNTAPSNRGPLLGLGLVSILSIGCIAFIAYHFSTEHHEPVYAQSLDTRPDDVEVEPTSSQLLSIVSSVSEANAEEEIIESEEVEPDIAVQPGTPLQTAEMTTEAEEQVAKLVTPSDTEPAAMSHDEVQHWVQLGALSKVATARSFWDKLKQNHPELLDQYQHEIVGPAQAGGKLHHLRVGPLNASSAESLCLALQEAGTDCFCIKEDGAPMDHRNSKA